MEFNDLGDKLGRIHMQKQDFGKLQTRKVKALRKSNEVQVSADAAEDLEAREE